MTDKHCLQCGQLKPLSEFILRRGVPMARCRPCTADIADRRIAARNSVTVKCCLTCKSEKPVTDFHLNRASRDGYHTRCKACACQQKRDIASKDRQHARTLDRGGKLKSRYGITVDDYNRMLTCQNGRCGICGTNDPGNLKTNFQIDHNHNTGVVRGLLCCKCNRGIGFFNDDASLLVVAAQYLDSHSSTTSAA